jgi:peptidoglycan/LPS O-acetylase OafA/YrhL
MLGISPAANAPSPHVRGIDSIRFVCAIWVVIFHGNQPPLFQFADRSQWFWRVISAGYDCLFCGPAAVIVFFVISGFCIHYPYTGGKPVRALQFLARRYVRIGIPLVVVMAWSSTLTGEIHVVWGLLLWSLYCELVYYTLYPALRFLSLKLGWGIMLGAALAASVVLIALSPTTGMYSGMNAWDPVLGFPIWLSGCLLAERIARASPGEAPPRIWFWRTVALAASSLCYGLMLHTRIGFRWSLTVFAACVFFWLLAETRHYSLRVPNPWLERFGKASYSLYLTHTLALGMFAQIFAGFQVARTPWSGFVLRLATVFVVTTSFYFLVESPAHSLAKRLKVFA